MNTGRPQRNRQTERNEGIIRVRLLGPPEVLIDGAPQRFSSRKTVALLAYLSVERGAHPREKLATWLWPESNEDTARAALRNALAELRAVFGERWPPIARP